MLELPRRFTTGRSRSTFSLGESPTLSCSESRDLFPDLALKPRQSRRYRPRSLVPRFSELFLANRSCSRFCRRPNYHLTSRYVKNGASKREKPSRKKHAFLDPWGRSFSRAPALREEKQKVLPKSGSLHLLGCDVHLLLGSL